jgi:hypothetical protein
VKEKERVFPIGKTWFSSCQPEKGFAWQTSYKAISQSNLDIRRRKNRFYRINFFFFQTIQLGRRRNGNFFNLLLLH